MNLNEVIKYPILSEKTYAQMSSGIYTFAVDPKTNRAEVKKTIEFIFEVKVAKVNIINVDKKPTKLGRSEGFTNKIKKAIVYLAEGTINIYPDEVDATESKKEAKAKKKEMSTAEKKASEKIQSKAKEMSEAEKRVAEKIAAKAEKQTKAQVETKEVETKEVETKEVETKEVETKEEVTKEKD